MDSSKRPRPRRPPTWAPASPPPRCWSPQPWCDSLYFWPSFHIRTGGMGSACVMLGHLDRTWVGPCKLRGKNEQILLKMENQIVTHSSWPQRSLEDPRPYHQVSKRNERCSNLRGRDRPACRFRRAERARDRLAQSEEFGKVGRKIISRIGDV